MIDKVTKMAQDIKPIEFRAVALSMLALRLAQLGESKCAINVVNTDRR